MWYEFQLWLSLYSLPSFYWIDQLFTWGEGDMRDVVISSQTKGQAVIYWFVQATFLYPHWLFATTWLFFTWPIYCVILFFDLIDALFGKETYGEVEDVI